MTCTKLQIYSINSLRNDRFLLYKNIFFWRKSQKLSNQNLRATESLRSFIETSPLKRVNHVARTRSQINQSHPPQVTTAKSNRWNIFFGSVFFSIKGFWEMAAKLSPHLFLVKLKLSIKTNAEKSSIETFKIDKKLIKLKACDSSWNTL